MTTDIKMCDEPGCEKAAVVSYVWEWGQGGSCCLEHQVVHTQRAAALKRRVTFTPLNPGAPPPIERSERVRLTAERLAAEEELSEVKARGLELYQSNVKLTAEVQRLTLMVRELRAQLQDAREDRDLAIGERNSRTAELADAVDELDRIKRLVEASATVPVGATVAGLPPGPVDPELPTRVD